MTHPPRSLKHLPDTIRKIRTPSDKCSNEVMMYNLDVVIAVDYRVNSYEAIIQILFRHLRPKLTFWRL